MPVCHPYVFFGKMSIQVFCPFFDWVIYFFDTELHEFFDITLWSYQLQIFFPFQLVVLAMQKLLSVIRSNLFI